MTLNVHLGNSDYNICVYKSQVKLSAWSIVLHLLPFVTCPTPIVIAIASGLLTSTRKQLLFFLTALNIPASNFRHGD